MGNGDRIAGAIDIGGTKTALGLVREDGKWLALCGLSEERRILIYENQKSSQHSADTA